VDGTPAPGGIRVSDPSDRFEREAERTAEAVVAGTAVDCGSQRHEVPDPGSGPGDGGPVAVQRESGPTERLKKARKGKEPKTARDFNNIHYRLHGNPNDPEIDVVERRVDRDSGRPYYVKVGSVDKNAPRKPPTIKWLPQDEELPADWLPTITHLNGMNVRPDTGLEAARDLYGKIRNDDALIDNDSVDLLYTYSATHGFLDALSCINSKAGGSGNALSAKGPVTNFQKQLMLDAVRQEHRTVVSAHSRGSIKTDEAIDDVFRILMSDPKFAHVSSRKDRKKQVARAMQRFIVLLYEGNAVANPSQYISGTMLSMPDDSVSKSFGTSHHEDGKRGLLGQVRPTPHKPLQYGAETTGMTMSGGRWSLEQPKNAPTEQGNISNDDWKRQHNMQIFYNLDAAKLIAAFISE
jgi:hypothetical protein